MQCRQRDIEIEIRIFYGIKPHKKKQKKNSHTDLSIFHFAELPLFFARYIIEKISLRKFPGTNERLSYNVSSNRRIDSR